MGISNRENFLALGSEQPEEELQDVIAMWGDPAGQRDISFKPCF